MTPLLTIDEAASRLHKSARWLKAWLKAHPQDRRGERLYGRLGRTIIIEEEAIPLILQTIAETARPKPPPDRVKLAMECLPVPPESIAKGREVVYFIEAGEFIKIGTTKDVQARLWDLQCASPVPLKLLHVMPGNARTEKLVHREFHHLRSSGEWFSKSPDLLSWIEARYRP